MLSAGERWCAVRRGATRNRTLSVWAAPAPLDREGHVDEAVPDRRVADDVARLDRELDAGAELGGRERGVLREHLERGALHLEEPHATSRRSS